jgi:hypothetical protein
VSIGGGEGGRPIRERRTSESLERSSLSPGVGGLHHRYERRAA